MGRPFTDDEKKEIKNQIIDSATILFKTYPYKDVKVEAIAKAVGIGKGTLYLFYPSKEHVFIEVMMRFEEQLQLEINHTVEALESPKARIKESILIGLKQINDNQIYNALSDKSVMDKIFDLLAPEQIASLESADVSFLKQLVKDAPLKVEMSIAIDLLRGVFFMKFFDNQLLSPYNAFVEHYIEAILNQIL